MIRGASALLAGIERTSEKAGEFGLDVLDRERIRRLLGAAAASSAWGGGASGLGQAAAGDRLGSRARSAGGRGFGSSAILLVRRSRKGNRSSSAGTGSTDVLVIRRQVPPGDAGLRLPEREEGDRGVAGRFRASSSCFAISDRTAASGGRPSTGTGAGSAARTMPAAPEGRAAPASAAGWNGGGVGAGRGSDARRQVLGAERGERSERGVLASARSPWMAGAPRRQRRRLQHRLGMCGTGAPTWRPGRVPDRYPIPPRGASQRRRAGPRAASRWRDGRGLDLGARGPDPVPARSARHPVVGRRGNAGAGDAHDIGLDDHVVRPADEQQVLDIVAAQKDSCRCRSRS